MTPSKNLFTFSSGFPSPGGDFEEESLDLARLMVPHPEATYFMRVQGHTWKKSGIFDQDLLVVDRSRETRPHQVVLAVADGRFTLYRLPSSGLSKPSPSGVPDDFRVWGVVTYAVHPLG